MTLSKLWGGRFTKETNQLVETYTASIGYDRRLAFEDIEGSLAHVQMLGECGILPEKDVEQIKAGLHKIAEKIKNGEAAFTVENEDIHMNIEKMLMDEIGLPAGSCIQGGAGMTRWRPICTCMSGKRQKK